MQGQRCIGTNIYVQALLLWQCLPTPVLTQSTQCRLFQSIYCLCKSPFNCYRVNLNLSWDSDSNARWLGRNLNSMFKPSNNKCKKISCLRWILKHSSLNNSMLKMTISSTLQPLISLIILNNSLTICNNKSKSNSLNYFPNSSHLLQWIFNRNNTYSNKILLSSPNSSPIHSWQTN